MASTLSWNKGPALAKRVTLLLQLHKRDETTHLRSVTLAVSSAIFHSVMLESWLETTMFIFTTGKNKAKKTHLKFRDSSGKTKNESVCPASGDQRNIVVDLSVLSISHLGEEIIKTCTKAQITRLLQLSHSSEKRMALDFSPILNISLSFCHYDASQKMSESFKTVFQRIQPNCQKKNFSLFSNINRVGHHANSY